MPSHALIEPEGESLGAAGKPLYGRDFYTWTREQAAALSDGRLQDLDLANLAEEVADMGSEKFNQLARAYRITLIHMLKWDHQPKRRSRGWVTSILTQRIDAAYVLKDNPGLKSRSAEAVERGYAVARIRAAGETGLPEKALPTTCPYTLDEIMSRPFAWPET